MLGLSQRKISRSGMGNRWPKVGEAGKRLTEELQVVEHEEEEERLNKRTPNDLSVCNAAILRNEEDYVKR